MAQCPTCYREYNVQDYLAHKDLEKANATIAVLRIDRDRWMEDAMGKASTINRLTAATEDRNEVDEIREKHHQEDLEELRAKLVQTEAFKDYVHGRLNHEEVPIDPSPESTTEHGCRIQGRLDWVFTKLAKAEEAIVYEQANNIGFRKSLREAEAELTKLRAAVPEDVKKAVTKLEETCNAFAFYGVGSDEIDEAEQDLLFLIGVLIARSKEERRKEIIEHEELRERDVDFKKGAGGF